MLPMTMTMMTDGVEDEEEGEEMEEEVVEGDDDDDEEVEGQYGEESAAASADANARTTEVYGLLRRKADEEEGRDEANGSAEEMGGALRVLPSGHQLALLTADQTMSG